MKIIVNTHLKKGVLDPQGKAVHHALLALQFDEVENVRIGKQIILQIEDGDKTKTLKRVEKMCEDLLANTVIETYTIDIED
ncbi:MAG: phosphoribosylformylglycinamidine synthase subunit PurS [Epsilonproteobacteria bacterium]|nr:phosphoribosylformylglycinamidine synthase subunit PurS [Campylobacterota bacterium]